MSIEITTTTTKLTLGTPVVFSNVTAIATHLRRVSRVNHNNWNSPQFSFVANVCAQTTERPRVMFGALSFTNSPCPLVYALEILDGNTATGAFSISNNVLGYTMIHVTLEPTFSPTQLNQSTLGAISSDLLKLRLTPSVPLSLKLYFIAAPDFAIASCGNINDAHVNADKIPRWLLWLLLNIANYVKIEPATSVDQSRTIGPMPQEILVMLIGHPVDMLNPTIGRRDGDSTVSEKTPKSGVQLNTVPPLERSEFSIPPVCFPLLELDICLFLILVQELVRRTNPGNGANNVIGREGRELFANQVVASVMQIILAVGVLFLRQFANHITSSIILGHCIQ